MTSKYNNIMNISVNFIRYNEYENKLYYNDIENKHDNKESLINITSYFLDILIFCYNYNMLFLLKFKIY